MAPDMRKSFGNRAMMTAGTALVGLALAFGPMAAKAEDAGAHATNAVQTLDVTRVAATTEPLTYAELGVTGPSAPTAARGSCSQARIDPDRNAHPASGCCRR